MNDEFEDSDDDDARVALIPGPGADLPSEIERYVDADLLNLYEVHSYRHAANILSSSQTDEFEQIKNALRRFRLTTDEIRSPGGNETTIVKRITELLRKDGWQETRIFADLKVTKESKRQIVRETRSGKIKLESVKELETVDIPNFVGGHKVDFVKNRVAFDMEWNSKDQTFDRDLYAFRAFYDCSLISAGILLTRSASLNPVFASLGDDIKKKYGASTTWMGKLLYRLNAGRSGGCPVVVFGITPQLIEDWKAEP